MKIDHQTPGLVKSEIRFTLNDRVGSIQLLFVSGSDMSPVNAARISKSRDDLEKTKVTERDAGLIDYLLKHSHGTPFEHNSLTFRVVAPIFVIRQWQRHRIGHSYNEVSGRYSTLNVDRERFYTPSTWPVKDKVNKQGSDFDGALRHTEDKITPAEWYEMLIKQSQQTYKQLILMGVSDEYARLGLPVSLYTEMFWTVNLRSLFHFCELRADSHAQMEIRQFANAALDAAQEFFPVAVDKFKYRSVKGKLLEAVWDHLAKGAVDKAVAAVIGHVKK